MHLLAPIIVASIAVALVMALGEGHDAPMGKAQNATLYMVTFHGGNR